MTTVERLANIQKEGKLERLEKKRQKSRNYLKSGTTVKARMTGMIPAPIYWRNDAPCAIRRYQLNYNLRIYISWNFFLFGERKMLWFANSIGTFKVKGTCSMPVARLITIRSHLHDPPISHLTLPLKGQS